jgi:hypothetical protein
MIMKLKVGAEKSGISGKTFAGVTLAFGALLGAVLTGIQGRSSRSVASVPAPGRNVDGSMLAQPVQPVSEIRAQKEPAPNFDKDIARLAEQEGRYRENLPVLTKSSRIMNPVSRIAARKYRYSGRR